MASTEEEIKILKWCLDSVDDSGNITLFLYMSCPDDWQGRSTEVQANVMRHIFGTLFWKQFIPAIETRASPIKNAYMRLGMALQEKKDVKIVAINEDKLTNNSQCNASAIIIVDAGGNYNMIRDFWHPAQWPLEINKLMGTPPSELQLEYIGNLVFLVEKTEDQSGNRLIKIWGLINRTESPDLQYAACLLIECKTGAEDQTQSVFPFEASLTAGAELLSEPEPDGVKVNMYVSLFFPSASFWLSTLNPPPGLSLMLNNILFAKLVNFLAGVNTVNNSLASLE